MALFYLWYEVTILLIVGRRVIGDEEHSSEHPMAIGRWYISTHKQFNSTQPDAHTVGKSQIVDRLPPFRHLVRYKDETIAIVLVII